MVDEAESTTALVWGVRSGLTASQQDLFGNKLIECCKPAVFASWRCKLKSGDGFIEAQALIGACAGKPWEMRTGGCVHAAAVFYG